MTAYRPSSEIERQLCEFTAVLPPRDDVPDGDDFAAQLQWEAWDAHKQELENELEQSRTEERRLEHSRRLTCLSLIELAYSKVFDPLVTVVGELECERAMVASSADIRGPEKLAQNLITAISQAQSIIRVKEETKDLFLPPADADMDSLHEMLEQIKNGLISPLSILTGREPVEYETSYRELAEKVGKPLLQKLLPAYQEVSDRHRDSARGLNDLLNTGIASDEVQGNWTCLSIDMARYSLLARQAQASQGAKALFSFNRELQGHLARALQKSGIKPEETPISDTGDGTLIFVKEATDAVRFAMELNKENLYASLGVSDTLWHQHLRIGIDSGEVSIEVVKSADRLLSFNSAGVPIINAVRIESACPKGRIAISRTAWRQLSSEYQPLFRSIEQATPPSKESHEPRLKFYVSTDDGRR